MEFLRIFEVMTSKEGRRQPLFSEEKRQGEFVRLPGMYVPVQDLPLSRAPDFGSYDLHNWWCFLWGLGLSIRRQKARLEPGLASQDVESEGSPLQYDGQRMIRSSFDEFCIAVMV